jgi:hypothetical protein
VSEVIPLSAAARCLRIPYYQAHKLLLTEQLEPAERRASYGYVSAEARLIQSQVVYPASR